MLPVGEWICHDVNAFELALFADRGTVELEAKPNESNRISQFRENYVSILIIRSGAIGDLLFLSPAIRALQAKKPDVRVTLACFEKHNPIAQGFPEVEIIPYPVSLDVAQKFDYVISLENVVENETEMHATDTFAKYLNVSVTNYRPSYEVYLEEILAMDGYTMTGMPRVALQLKASARSRDYPMPLWERVIDGLTERGWEILLYGSAGQIPKIVRPKDNVHDCSHLTFREAAALLKTCKVFCGVDSAFMNLCPALDVPAIGLYGPVKWQTRIGKAGKQLGLTGTKSCSGCNWMNSRAGQLFPPDMPCAKLGYCEVLAEIDPKRIIAKIDEYRK